jgi:Tfx family DNA-binding protein
LQEEQIVHDVAISGLETKLPKSLLGFLTEKQFRVLELRSRGYTQREVAQMLRMSRAGVSMIEGRAREQVDRARKTVKIFELISQNQHKITIPIGTRLQKIPVLILQDADHFQVHIQFNMIEISRMVRRQKPDCLINGVTVKELVFSFNERGIVSIQ